MAFPLPRPSVWDKDATGKHPYFILQVAQHGIVTGQFLNL
jgi:hypothetical protein